MLALRLAQIARTYLPVAIFTATALYFIFHLVTGERGLLAFMAIKRELNDATVILADLEVEKVALERDVELLNDTPIISTCSKSGRGLNWDTCERMR